MLIALIKKQNVLTAIIGLMLIFIVSSCKKDCFEAAGSDSQIIIPVSDFTSIELQNSFTIHLIQDSLNFIEIKGKENLISNIEPKINNKRLSFVSSSIHLMIRNLC